MRPRKYTVSGVSEFEEPVARDVDKQVDKQVDKDVGYVEGCEAVIEFLAHRLEVRLRCRCGHCVCR